jgi:hypothetical protein
MKKALITGASSGLGEVFARELANDGYDLILVARRLYRLERIAEEIEKDSGRRPIVLRADLTVVGDVEKTGSLLKDVNLLVNNAGFGLIGAFDKLDSGKEQEMIRLNVEALYYLTKKYIEAREGLGGGIINVASTAAYIPVPYMAVYSATKAFVLHFSEAIGEELKDRNFKVMVLSPGPTKTEFFKVATGGKKKMPGTMLPEDVVRAAIKAFGKGRRSLIPGFMNRVIASGSKISPKGLILRTAGKVFKNGLI